jgi:hypothetical protein
MPPTISSDQRGIREDIVFHDAALVISEFVDREDALFQDCVARHQLGRRGHRLPRSIVRPTL